MTEALTLAEVVGTNLRRIREQRGWLQDEVARRVQRRGVSWTPSVVASIEAGGRGIHFSELVVAAAELGVAFDELMTGKGRVGITDELTVDLSNFRAAVRGKAGGRRLLDDATADVRRRAKDGSLEGRLAAEGAIGEAEYRVGRQLDLSPVVVARYAQHLWGRWLWEERDARVKAARGTDLSPRSLQAARGHVMRQLIAELRDQVAEDQEKAEQMGEAGPEWDWLTDT